MTQGARIFLVSKSKIEMCEIHCCGFPPLEFPIAFVGTLHVELLFLVDVTCFLHCTLPLLLSSAPHCWLLAHGSVVFGASATPNTVLGGPLFRFLMLDNDTEYFVEPRFVMSGASSWRERDGEASSLWRTRTSLGTAMGGEADWEIMPEDIVICKDPYGRDWQLGTGGFGSVRSLLQCLL